MRPVLLASSVVAALALAVVTAALGGQPVTQILTPPPPDWQTCKAVGTGTICEGTNVESAGPYDTGIVCGSGPGAFDGFDTSTDDYFVRKWFDENGNLVRRFFHDHYTFGQFSNPLAATAVPYTQTDTRTDVLAVPGEVGSATTTTTWEIVFHLAGGAPVLRNTGRTVIASDGTLTARAGRLPFSQATRRCSTSSAPHLARDPCRVVLPPRHMTKTSRTLCGSSHSGAVMNGFL